MRWIVVLDWALISTSFFNTIAMLWLGLTVLLNAEHRTWGTWAAGGGLVLGGLYFAGHSAVVGRIIGTFDSEMEFWWRISWVPVVGAPYGWYLVTIFYTGMLSAGRHRRRLTIVSLLGLAALLSLAVSNPLPSYGEVLRRAPVEAISIGGVPIGALTYPIFSVLCIVLSLLALRRPVASERFMGDLARERARPWLIAASLVLLGVSLLVGAVMLWFLATVASRPPQFFYLRSLPLFMAFDLAVSTLLAVVVVLTGRAIVSYEIFTGKTLPRGELFRYWRRSLLLAGGYGALIGASLIVPIESIYRLLLATILMTLFLALISWRSYVDREQSMDHIRPFVASQRLYEHLLKPAAPDVDATVPFQALCGEVLNARVAYLAALGSLAPLVGAPLVYPVRASGGGAGTAKAEPPGQGALQRLAASFRSPQTMCVPLDPGAFTGAVWAVPLWSERGLIGVLLLGEKRDGGLYTQEEIEIARATGERLIDTEASAEMARRLMALQRRRLAEGQVLDRRTRRVLHDDVLPRLHTALLAVSSLGAEGSSNGQSSTVQEVVSMLAEVHGQISNLLRAMPANAGPEVARLGVVGALRQTIDSELATAFDGVTWRTDPAALTAAQAIPELTAEVMVYAAREVVRNAARHGRNGDPRRPLHLLVGVEWRDGLEIVIEDDGVGLGGAEGSTSGSGQGLTLHSTMMAVVGGSLTAESSPGAYTRVSLALPQAAFGEMAPGM